MEAGVLENFYDLRAAEFPERDGYSFTDVTYRNKG